MAVLPPDPVFILKGDMGYVHSLAYLTYEKNYTRSLFAATESGFVYLWDLESNRVKYKQPMGKSIQAIHSVDNNLITQEKSGELKSWIIRESSYELLCTVPSYGGFCKSLVIDDHIVIPTERNTLGIFDVNLNKLATIKSNEDGLGDAMCLEKAVIKERDYILAGYESGDVVLYEVNSGKQCGKLRLKECVTSISFDEVTRRAVVGNASSDLQIIIVNPDLNIGLKAEIAMANEGCGTIRIRPDKRILVCGGWDGRLRLFSWRTLRALAVLTEHKQAITDIQFSPYVVDYWGSNIMAASSGDGTISLWNLYN